MIQAGGIPPVPAAEQAPLLIARQGSFAVGGNILQRPGTYDNSRFPGWRQAVEAGQSYHADHAAVDFQIPADARMLPLIFIHGYGQSARCWQTTPDGREGFNDMFLRKRYATYLVDLPGRGRAGRTTAETAIRPLADEQFWFDIFRIGEWPAFNPGVQFPTDKDSLDQFFRQMTPDIGTHDMTKELDALSALFKRVGKGILVTHSAGGFPGWLTAIRSPEVRGIISLEPGTYVFPEGEVPEDMPSLTGTMKESPFRRRNSTSSPKSPSSSTSEIIFLKTSPISLEGKTGAYVCKWDANLWRPSTGMAAMLLWWNCPKSASGEIRIF